MVKHIVMWNLTDKDKVAENGAIMKQKLEALVGVVPGLLRAEVGVGFNGYDVALYIRPAAVLTRCGKKHRTDKIP